MIFPEELFVKEILPKIRIILSNELYKKGFSQTKIANVLGITQARVNFYLKQNIELAYKKLEKMGINKLELFFIIQNILNEKIFDKVTILKMIRNFWLNILVSGAICNYHVNLAKLPFDCSICLKPPLKILNEKEKMIKEIKEAVKILESSNIFYLLIPEININIAYSLPKANKREDILSFPGRLIKYKTKLKAISEPEFGSSQHLAFMLIEAHKKNHKIRACMYIKYDEFILRIIKKLKLNYDFNYNKKELNVEDPVLISFQKYLKERDVPTILIDKGGYGLEPICYIFGKKPKEIVDISLKISEEYFRLKL